eukprot:313095-Pyramimonas_sp.AAC.1
MPQAGLEEKHLSATRKRNRRGCCKTRTYCLYIATMTFCSSLSSSAASRPSAGRLRVQKRCDAIMEL